MEHKKELAKLMKSMARKHNLHTIFRDFTQLGAIAISNRVDLQNYENREAKYLQTIKKYDESEADRFAEMFAILIDGLNRNMTDLLGETYMELEISNKHRGQFFTPMNVAKLMAALSLSNYEAEISERGYIELNEPAVGGGVTVIALASALRNKGYNYQKVLKVVCQDIDMDLVHLCYMQLSILGIDAVVMRGDTLAYKFDSFWYTPMHVKNTIEERSFRVAKT